MINWIYRKKTKLKAAAIKYDVKKDKAPRVLALGKGSIAEKILELAEEHHIPIYEDKVLSELLSKLNIESEIPPQLYTVVAELLAFVYQLNKLTKERRLQPKMIHKKAISKKKG